MWRPIVSMLALLGPAGATPVEAWSPQTRLEIARQAASITPHDLRRQLDRHAAAYTEGVRRAGPAAAAGRRLAPETVRREADAAVRAIQSHRPFTEVVEQLGVVAAWVAEAGSPPAGWTDELAARNFDDYEKYVDSARPRFSLAFYGGGRALETSDDLAALLSASRDRVRRLDPMVRMEYDRIHHGRGVERFDDRSTAFGVAAIGVGHSVSDVFAVLRYIWLRAGGFDPRQIRSLTRPQSAR